MKIYQLKILLQDVKPEVWRQIHMAEQSTLIELHTVIQALMCWEDFQQHIFTHQKKPLNENISLQQAFKDTKEIHYTYGLEHPWEHLIQLEEPLSPSEKSYPICIAGEGACPLENCQGAAAYIEILEALKDQSDFEHESIREWVGKHFNPNHFEVNQINSVITRKFEEA